MPESKATKYTSFDQAAREHYQKHHSGRTTDTKHMEMGDTHAGKSFARPTGHERAT